jgi:hypothetical protein
MADLLVLAPGALLLAGAVLVFLAPARLSRWQGELPWSAAFLAVVAAALLALRAAQIAPMPLELQLSTWSDAPVVTGPALRVDEMAALSMLLTCVIVFIGLLRARVERVNPGVTIGPLLVASAAVLFVASTCQLLGLVFAWLILDVSILVATGGRRRSLIASQVGLLVVLISVIGVPAATSAICVTAAGGLSGLSRYLLIVAGIIRMGLYPFWWSLPHTDAYHVWKGPLIRLAPTIAGAVLVLRVVQFSQVGEGPNAVGLAFALVAVGFGAVLAFLSRHGVAAQDWATTVHAGLVCIAASFGGPVSLAIALVLLLDLAIDRTAEFVFLRSPMTEIRPARWARNVVALGLAGIPPTLGFAGRWLLFRELLIRRALPELAVVFVATVLTTPTFARRRGPEAPPEPAMTRRWRPLTAILVVLAGLTVFLGIGFATLQPLLVQLASLGLSQPLGELSTILRQLLTLSGRAARADDALLLLIVLGAPALGLALQRAGWSGRAAGSVAGRRLRRRLWLTRPARRLLASVIRAGAAVQSWSGLGEVRRTMAWTLLAVVLSGTAMIVALSPAHRPVVPPAATGGPAAVAFLVAAVIAAVLVLSSSAMLTLVALAAGYLVAALWPVIAADFAPGAVTVAAIKLLVGAIVVAILAISLLQDPRHQRLADAARRLRQLRGAAAEGRDRALPALAVLAGLVISFGLHSTTFVDQLPDAVLRPAAALITGGLLGLVFARSVLRLVAGVLLALIGFEVIYARLDDGLMVTGGLAAFQLLFAIVASLFVGRGESNGDPS